MKPEDLDDKLSRPDYVPQKATPSPVQPVGKVGVLAMDEAALAHAKKWKLLRTDGTVKCLHNGCDGDGTLPTLECLSCRRKRTGA